MHEDHRQRMYNRFLSEGLDGFEPHQTLELLLFFAIPRRDTNELAHRLITHFGSMSAVLDATSEELMQVRGIGQRTAVLLSMLPELLRKYRSEKIVNSKPLDSISKAAEYISTLYIGRTNEIFYLVCLDSKCDIIRALNLGEGTVGQTTVPPRVIVEAAIRSKAAQVIFAHNHPGGHLSPSPEDLIFTRRVMVSLASIDIKVADHIIVNDTGFMSFVREGLMEELRDVVNIRLSNKIIEYRDE